MAKEHFGPAEALGDPRPRRALPDPEPPAVGPPDASSSESADPETAAVGLVAGGEVPGRPARPTMDRTPAPVSPSKVRPKVLDVALGLVRGGLGVGAVGVVSALLWRSGSRENLLAAMAESVADEASKQRVADVVLYSMIGTLVLLMLVELATTVRLSSARAGARFALAAVVALQLVLLFFARDIVADSGWHGTVIQTSLLIHAAAALVGTLLTWSPSVGRWLGGRPVERAGPQVGG